MASPRKPDGGKALVQPSGVVAWHVHSGIHKEGRAGRRVDQRCAFVMHAVNMWTERLGPGEFATDKGGSWWEESGLLPAWDGSKSKECWVL